MKTVSVVDSVSEVIRRFLGDICSPVFAHQPGQTPFSREDRLPMYRTVDGSRYPGSYHYVFSDEAYFANVSVNCSAAIIACIPPATLPDFPVASPAVLRTA